MRRCSAGGKNGLLANHLMIPDAKESEKTKTEKTKKGGEMEGEERGSG